MDYEAILSQVVALLQRERRIAYRVLKRRLQLDDDLLEDLKDDLIYISTKPRRVFSTPLTWPVNSKQNPSNSAPP